MAAIAEMRVLARCMPTHTVLAVTNGKEAEKKMQWATLFVID